MPQAPSPPKSVLAWLLALYALVGAMVVVGGITRLTGSGLSMVEWRPLMGAIPPLTAAEWQQTFDLYQLSPQYLQVNHWMGLDDFKRIFLWEYLHRLLGRSIGVVCLVPWLWFLARRRLQGRFAWMTLAAFVLGGMQGALGWFMVKSGLVDVPAVSHLRLAAHLTLAFFVGMWLLWIALDVTRPSLVGAKGTRASKLAWGVAALVVVQIVYGAFMAGTRAGHLYATFPDMNGAWIAPGSFTMTPWLVNLVENPAAIHTVHRWLAWLVVVVVAGFVGLALRRTGDDDGRRALFLMLTAVLVQLTLGALTVVTHVNTAIAVLHQGVAYLLLSTCVMAAHRLRAPL